MEMEPSINRMLHHSPPAARIMYTCSTQGDPDYKTVLEALDLAHRWQVEVVVPILADLLETMITDESFAAIAEHAILKALRIVASILKGGPWVFTSLRAKFEPR